MGDHTCSRNDFAPVAPIPSPPPSAGFDSDRFAEAKVSRGPPLAIDPSAANRAFLQPNVPTPVSSVHMSSPLPANPAPASTVVRPSTHSLTDDSVFSFPMPGNRSPTEVRTQSTMMAQTASKSQSPVSSSGQAVALKPENVQLPPSPMPSKSPDTNHQREESVSSFASSRYGNSTTRSSVNSVSQGFRSIMDDTPPVPPAPLRTSKKNSVHRDSDVSVVPSPISKEEASGFDFGILRGQSPTSGPQALPEEPSSAQFQDQTQYVAFNPVHLHPVTEETEPGSDAPRKSSNASMTSVFSVTSFARALGLDDQMNSSESSGSDSSYSDARSGSSMSSLPSVASFNRYKPTDPLNLKHLAHTRQTVLEIPGHIRSSVEGVPHMPAALFSPDSPTDPSINRGAKTTNRPKVTNTTKTIYPPKFTNTTKAIYPPKVTNTTKAIFPPKVTNTAETIYPPQFTNAAKTIYPPKVTNTTKTVCSFKVTNTTKRTCSPKVTNTNNTNPENRCHPRTAVSQVDTTVVVSFALSATLPSKQPISTFSTTDPSAPNTTTSATGPFAPAATPASRVTTWKPSSGTLHGQIAVDSTPTACNVVHVMSFSRATTSSGMVKSFAKEMRAEPLLPPTHHLLVLLVVAGPTYPRLPSPSPANSLPVRTLCLVEDLDQRMDLDSTLVPDSPLEVEGGSPNDGLLGL
ncbi:hypothetical protein PDIG_36620 [Penicillium digitatum PHI26]|uniref:Uncharacterized protein n=1 Tax=Penicillium digitatum (strain PHI26 / CECT 20796) TaxID=1170229 RepID=K9FYL1_PEND2|nr:hypothetical protein PDIG_36620 [Penicillium digitatum PHI26]